MKKRVVFSLFCAAIMLVSAFAFVGCTDKPRELDDVEKSIVGEWKNDNHYIKTFNADGTWTDSNKNSGTFEHDGDGAEAKRGRYELILVGVAKYALFDAYPDLLCGIDSTGTILPNDSLQTLRRVVTE